MVASNSTEEQIRNWGMTIFIPKRLQRKGADPALELKNWQVQWEGSRKKESQTKDKNARQSIKG